MCVVEFISEDVMEELRMELKKSAVISDEFKEFIQSGNYEVSILKLMNQSRIVFPIAILEMRISQIVSVILWIRLRQKSMGQNFHLINHSGVRPHCG